MDQEYLLKNFPITYSGLVVETTTQCTASCGMCYQSASPNGSKNLGSNSLDIDIVKRVIRDAIEIPSLSSRFHIAGGEAFLNIEMCMKAIEEARKSGYTEISTTTNAFWAKSQREADKICRDLRICGLTRMEISWDFWHLPFIESSVISNCVRAAHKNNIEVNLRLMSTRVQKAHDALKLLDNDVLNEYIDIAIYNPLIHSGKAKKSIKKSEVYHLKGLGSSCHHMLNLTVNPVGGVSPCCAGLDQNKELHFGNVKESSIIDIARKMENSLLLRAIVFFGVGSLVPILEDSGYLLNNEHSSLCSLCEEIFSVSDHVRVLVEKFRN